MGTRGKSLRPILATEPVGVNENGTTYPPPTFENNAGTLDFFLQKMFHLVNKIF